jgi:hypothetical protein
MKKILATISMICFMAFISNAQTTPTATAKATTSKEVKTETTAKTDMPCSTASEAKKAGCCHKNMTAAECKAAKASKNCGAKTSTEAKAEKTSASGGGNN